MIMSEWVTGRKPTQADADKDGMVLTAEVGLTYWGCVSSYWAWMRNPPMPPEPPKPRTLEDATRDYLKALDPVIDPRRSTKELLELQSLRDEMESFIKEKE